MTKKLPTCLKVGNLVVLSPGEFRPKTLHPALLGSLLFIALIDMGYLKIKKDRIIK